jgi:hypothetical protein
VFGEKAITWDEGKLRPYKKFSLAFDEVTVNHYQKYGFTPFNPSTPMGKGLFLAVRQKLPREDRRHLGLYAAIDTDLDHLHKVDGFFLLRRRITTIDLSLRRDKKHTANFLIHRDDLLDEERLEKLGQEIAHHLTKEL